MNKDYDVAVIGSGMSGLMAARQCAERGATVVCIDENIVPGGLIGNVGKLDGFPTTTPISGGALADSAVAGCKMLGVDLISASVRELLPVEKKTAMVFHSSASSLDGMGAKAVIVASGARLRQLEVPGAMALTGRGVSQCDWCDGGLFRNQAVAVVGGGDAAYQAALHLAGICRSVSIIMRGSEIKARRCYVEAAAENERISFLWDTVVTRVVGTERVEGLLLSNPSEKTEETLPVNGVFVFIGTKPNSDFLPTGIERDAEGGVITDAKYRTSLPGIFAVGAVRSGYSGQLVSACGEAASVASLAVADAESRTTF